MEVEWKFVRARVLTAINTLRRTEDNRPEAVCKAGTKENVEPRGTEFRDPDARMFDATLEVIRLLSATIAARAQWRTSVFN